MKRPTALIASAGILLGACGTAERPVVGVRESAGPRLTAEVLQSYVNSDIVPRLGSTGLALILGTQDKETDSVTLVVTRDSYCASSFIFSKEEESRRSRVIVSLNLFGNFLDLIDNRQLEGSAMFDGTIGHGDNVVTESTGYMPGNINSVNTTLEYMKQGTDKACGPLNLQLH